MTRANDNGGLQVLEVINPDRRTLPVLVSSPHSGRNYDPSFLGMTRLDSQAIRRSEDAFVDRLIAGVPALGAPTIAALFPRAWIDVNREPGELDCTMFEGRMSASPGHSSPRVRAGLGIIPRVVAGGEEIYRSRLPVSEAQRRIASCYTPYHAALESLIDETRRLFGAVCLIDCHSMPTARPACDRKPVDIVLGDRFGTSCAPAVSRAATAALQAQGATVRRNNPYPGGHITMRYGRPDLGMHAIQIEVDRRLYLDEATVEPTAGMAATARLLEAAILAIARVVRIPEKPAGSAGADIDGRRQHGMIAGGG
ncbi:MAG: N-formylglutamate amidohydrolase [bacterium]|nr:N-formylglutamate amidohydrolase [bacterium]MDE0238875.1 N-formylglutamate amidohydrolase [bacterium]MDE0418664.1 N-formylglutamate amidohydrolase [bacterium]